MGNRKCKPIIKLIQNQKGETLVETIVSFAVFLVALAAITTLIYSATAMNTKAAKNSDKIEAAATKVEQAMGTAEGANTQADENATAGTMTLDFGDGAPVKIDVAIGAVDPFVYFVSSSGGGANEKQ